MARGGARQGRPGVAYKNRSDLSTNRMPQTGTQTAAAGGITPPPAAPTVPPVAPPGSSPDDTPNLFDPGTGGPMTAGLPTGPGPGPQPNKLASDPIILKYLPHLEKATTYDGAPPTFRAFVRYLQGM